MSAAAIIARLTVERDNARALVDMQNGALVAQGVDAIDAPEGLMTILTPQERAFVGLLFRAYPRVLPRGTITDLLPHRDHARDHDSKLPDVLASRVRTALGAESVETVRQLGYRLGAELHAALKKDLPNGP